MTLFKNIRLVFIFILLLVVPSLVMAISWTAMPGLGSGQYNSVAVEDFNKDGYKDIAGVKGDTASVWQQSLSWVCPASLYSWSFKGTDNGPSFSATYNAVAAGDMGSGPGNSPNLKPDGMPDTVVATAGGIYIFYGNSLDTWNSTPPVKGVVPANTGYGRMSGVGTNSNTPADNWTVQCIAPRQVTTNLPQSTSNGGTLNYNPPPAPTTLPYPNLLNPGDTYRFTFSNLSTASGVNPKKAFTVKKGELEVGTGRVDQSFTTIDNKISISPGDWSNTNLILPDETIDFTINSMTPATFSVTGATTGSRPNATADTAYSDAVTGLSFTVSEDKNAGFIAGDKFTFSTYAISGNLITGSATDVVSLRLADVDNDGELEIVAGTQSGIKVYDYNGVLWSAMNTNLPTTGEWRGIAVRDMDRDGNMDIVAASTTAGFIKAWHGDGAGNWTAADDLTTSSAIYYSLDVEDINRDGIYDIIAGVGDSGIEVWLGDPNGNFTQASKPTGTDRYYDVKIADINYDRKPDILGGQWGGGILVWLGNGSGDWTPETAPIDTGDYRSIAVVDFNNDGLMDVTGASYGGGVDVFLQSRVVDPAINWAKASFPTASGDFQGTAVGDFNRDGNQDVVVAGNASGVRVFYGDGKTKVKSSTYVNNGFTGTGNGKISKVITDDTKTKTENWEVKCVTGGANPVFQVSRNGVAEAALYSLPGTYTHAATGVSFSIGLGATDFAVNDTFRFRTIEGGITNSGIYYGVVTADFNNDGILDVAAASNGGGGIDIWYGNGEGEWDSVSPTDALWDGDAQAENMGSGDYYYLAVGDVNSDGKLDIVAGSDATGVHVFLNGWDGSTTAWTHNASPPQDPVGTGSYSGVALADFDNDGNLDIAAASRGGDGVMVWLGNGDGSFSATNTGPDFSSSVILTDEYGMGRSMTYYYDGIAAADFDKDGNMDIVAGNLGNFGVQVFYGDGDKLRHGHVTWNLSTVTPPVPACGNAGDVYIQDLAASSYGQSYYGKYGSFGKDIYIGGTKVRAGVATHDYVTGNSDVTLTGHQPTQDDPWDFTDPCSLGGASLDFPFRSCTDGEYGYILRGTSYSYDPPDLLYFSTYNPGVTTSGQYYGVATEDFNKDGYLDIVAANKNNGGIQVWLNGGSKSFYRVPKALKPISSVWTSATDPVVNGNYKGVAVLDFNRDGNMDIVGAHDFTGGTGAEVWLNSVDLIPPTVVSGSPSPESGATDISTGASISARFSEDVDILTLRNNDTTGSFSPSGGSTIMVYGSKSGYHSGVINYDSTTFTVTFYPDIPFTTNEIITVTFSSKIADPAGNHLDGNGDGTGSDTPSDYFLWSFTVVDTVKPLPPTSVTGTAGEGKSVLSWVAPVKNEDNSALADLAGFNVYRGNVSGGPYFKINSTAVSSSVTTYTNSPLTNGATYYYVITAVDQYGNESVNSTPQVSVTPALDTVKPSAPSSFAAVAGNKKVTLTWTAPTTNVDGSTLTDLAGYWLYRGTATGVYGSGPINSVLIPAGTVEYIDTTAANGTTYYYAVTAVDSSIGANESAKSTEASAAPVLDVTAPDAPSSVAAQGGAAEITLSWTVPAAVSDFNSYNIYRHTASFTNVTDTGVTLVKTITDYNVTSWKDSTSNSLVIDTTYYYRITSTDTNGNESATPSNQVSAVPVNPVGALGLFASDYIIPADGVAQTTITAIAQTPLGYPVADGTTIKFSVSCSASECGTISASSATTSGGQASVTITSSTILTNSVTITASSGTVSGSTTIAFKPGPPSTITLSASPSSIPASTASTTNITAYVEDEAGNAVKDGLYVTIRTTLGTFSNGTQTSDPVATSGGKATVTLNTAAVAGTATVDAFIGLITASSSSGTINVTFTLTSAPASPSGLKAVAGDSKVTLSWTANTETDLAGYNVYRSSFSGRDYTKVNTGGLVSKATTSYIDTGLKNGTTYYYVITAVNSSSLESSYSSQVSATPYTLNAQLGDVSGDGKVDGTDLTNLGAAFGSRPGDANWNQYADFNSNGRIDGGDLVIFGWYFGKGVTW